MPMIRVPRDLVRRSAAELSKLPGWKRRPCTCLKSLIYGLNTIFANLPSLKYNHGFPRPSVTFRELEGVRGLCRGTKRADGTSAVMARVEALISRDADSYGLLLFQAARVVDNGWPERAITDGRALQMLRQMTRDHPRQLEDMIVQALKGLRNLVKQGRGGNRNRGAMLKRELIWKLGILFENVTGTKPAITHNVYTSTYSGRFYRFVRDVFESLSLTITGRQIFHFLKAIQK